MRTFSVDLRSLALFRVLIGLVLIADLVGRFVEAASGCSAQLAVPSAFVFQWPVSLYRFAVAGLAYRALLALNITCAVCLIIGFRTRAANIACWALLLWLHHRNPFVLHGGDHLLILMLFWSIFVPLGARWSVDARKASSTVNVVFSEATAALLLQPCIMYLFSGLHKLRGDDWRVDGSAVYFALSQRALSGSRWVCELLLNYPTFLKAITYGTLVIELAAPFLLLATWRRPIARISLILALVAFHVGIAICFRIGLFPWVCIVALTPFIPSCCWEIGPSTSIETSVGQSQHLHPYSAAMLGALILYVLALNVASLGVVKGIAWATLQSSGYAFGVVQNWSLFAPNPPHRDAWHECTGRLAGRRSINLLFPNRDPDDRRPLHGHYYPSLRWRKLLEEATKPGTEKLRLALAAHFQQCFAELTEIRIMHHFQEMRPPSPLGTVQSEVLFEQNLSENNSNRSPGSHPRVMRQGDE